MLRGSRRRPGQHVPRGRRHRDDLEGVRRWTGGARTTATVVGLTWLPPPSGWGRRGQEHPAAPAGHGDAADVRRARHAEVDRVFDVVGLVATTKQILSWPEA